MPRAEPEEISNEAAKYGLYVQSLAALRKEKYDEAGALLDSLITLDAGYRDASDLRDRVRQQQRLGAAYETARGRGGCRRPRRRARRGYRNVLDVDPTHRDAQSRHDAPQRRLTVASLKDELRVHADEEDWEAVLAVSAELARLDPDAADPDGLASRALEMTASEQAQPTRPRRARAGEHRGTRTIDVTAPPTESRSGHGGRGGPSGRRGPGSRRTRWPRRTRTRPAARARDPTRRRPAAARGDHDRHPPGGTASRPPLEEVGGDRRIRRRPRSGRPLPAGQQHRQRRWGRWRWRGGGVTVTCWDGSQADGASSCPLPTGFNGVASVFPAMDSNDCQQTQPSVDGKVELYECTFDRYTIRYSRWKDGFDKYAYLDQHIKNAKTADWTEDGVTYGRTWTGLDPKTSETEALPRGGRLQGLALRRHGQGGRRGGTQGRHQRRVGEGSGSDRPAPDLPALICLCRARPGSRGGS